MVISHETTVIMALNVYRISEYQTAFVFAFRWDKKELKRHIYSSLVWRIVKGLFKKMLCMHAKCCRLWASSSAEREALLQNNSFRTGDLKWELAGSRWFGPGVSSRYEIRNCPIIIDIMGRGNATTSYVIWISCSFYYPRRSEKTSFFYIGFICGDRNKPLEIIVLLFLTSLLRFVRASQSQCACLMECVSTNVIYFWPMQISAIY